jgi:Fe-S-cluster-containing hydrogenase component 2
MILKTKPELCTQCGQCEKVCSRVWFKEENPEKSAIRVNSKGDGVLINVCNQCGECIEVCPTEAIYRAKNGVVRIDKEKCVGCYSCVGFCPTVSMFFHKDVQEPFKCVACGMCAKECPTGAIYLEK